MRIAIDEGKVLNEGKEFHNFRSGVKDNATYMFRLKCIDNQI